MSAPTGIYGVGIAKFPLLDPSRKETNNKDMQRELLICVWYPTYSKTDAPHTPYDPDALLNWQEFISKQSGIPIWLLSGLKATRVYAKDNAQIVHDQSAFPVIILSHGAGPMIQHYTWLGEELASQGYIVVGINHPYMATTRFPDGRLIKSLLNSKKKEGKQVQKQWKQEQLEVAVQDVSFVIDRLSEFNESPSSPLYKKLDLEHIGICGHSAGGSLAMRMCLEDNRIKAGVALDSTTRGNYLLKPFVTPFLAILAEKSHVWAGHEGKIDREKLQQLSRMPHVNMKLEILKNSGHGIFTDLPSLLHQTFLIRVLSKYLNFDMDTSSKEAMKAQNFVKPVVVKFFDKILKSKNINA